MYHDPSPDYHCHCPTADESHEAGCSQYKEELENFGFHVRGDAPVIIAHVEINSLADVSLPIPIDFLKYSILNAINSH